MTLYRKVVLGVLGLVACAAMLALPASAEDVAIAVGSGSGFKGGQNSQVQISLSNANDKVRKVTLKVCDVDNYLNLNTVLKCQTTSRTASFTCSAIESLGCAVVQLNPGPAALISKGSGAIATLSLDVASGAPAGACRALNPQDLTVYDEYNDLLSASSTSGSFCFSSCSTPADCQDSLYCSGTDTCSSGICAHTGNPCSNTACNHCNEADETCYDPAGTSCTSDGIFCNGDEICNGSGACQPSGIDPCPDGSTCNEGTDACDCDGSEDCGDGLFCTGFDYCVPGDGVCESMGDPCAEPLHCDESRNMCVCYYHNECDDGLYCNGEETCSNGYCLPGTDPCSPPLYCNEEIDMCTNPDVVVTVGDGGGFIGDVAQGAVDIGVSNIADQMTALSIAICDSENYLDLPDNTIGTCSAGSSNPGAPCQLSSECPGGTCVIPQSCVPSSRVPGYGYTCVTAPMSNGCDMVVLYRSNPAAPAISQGTGKLLTIKYSVKAPGSADTGCLVIDPSSITASDGSSNPLTASGYAGDFCIYCFDDGDCENNPCTDDSCSAAKLCTHINNSNTCDDGLFCTESDRCTNGACSGYYTTCDPYYLCDEEEDQCVACPGDYDCDGSVDASDNCLTRPNDYSLGTCTRVVSQVVLGTGVTCLTTDECPMGQVCSNAQEDFDSNDIGDACECYADISGTAGSPDGKVDSFDLLKVKQQFGRTGCTPATCAADMNDDTKVDSFDLLIIKSQFGRSGCPLP